MQSRLMVAVLIFLFVAGLIGCGGGGAGATTGLTTNATVTGSTGTGTNTSGGSTTSTTSSTTATTSTATTGSTNATTTSGTTTSATTGSTTTGSTTSTTTGSTTTSTTGSTSASTTGSTGSTTTGSTTGTTGGGGGSTQLIFFRGNLSDVNDIIGMDPAGGGPQTQITTGASDFEPSFNGNGTEIVFWSNAPGQPEIYVVKPDGSDKTRLTFTAQGQFLRGCLMPTFNKEGTKIAFCSNRDAGSASDGYDLYIMDRDGSNITRLTSSAKASYPKFSPDGSKIIFSRDVNNQLYSINPDGTGLTQITTHPSGCTHASYRSDGQKIVFVAANTNQIWIMDPDGSNRVQVTNNFGNNYNPCFSADGSKIYFWGTKDGNGEIYVINSDGTNETRLTHHNWEDRYPFVRQFP